MATNRFSHRVVAWFCRVCVDYVLMPVMLQLCEIEYELRYGEKCPYDED